MRQLGKIRAPLAKLENTFSKTIFTLSIEGASIRLLSTDGKRVLGWQSMPFNPRMVSEGRIEDPAALANVIKNAVTRFGIKVGMAVAAFPSSRVTSRVMSLPSVKGVKPDELIPREARRVMGSAVDFHYLFWTPLTRVGFEQTFYLLAAPKSELVAFLQTLSLSGINPKMVDSRALALSRSVGASSAIILNVEALGVDVLVVLGHVPVVVARRDLPMGMAVNEVVEEISDEYQNSVGYYNDRNPGNPIQGNTAVYLTGGHPQLVQGLRPALMNSLRTEFEVPTLELEHGEDFPVSTYMVNLGLALKAA